MYLFRKVVFVVIVLFLGPILLAQTISLSTLNTAKLCDGYVEATGITSIDRTNPNFIVPRMLFEAEGVKKITSNSGLFYLLIDESGQVWSVGENRSGELGLGDTIYRYKPEASAELNNVQDIVSFGLFSSGSMALKSDGSVWVWGGNSTGMLGLGDSMRRLFPIPLNGISNAKIIGGGNYNAYVATMNGEVYGWGLNQMGQIGDGTTQSSNVPVRSKMNAHLVQIEAGDFHAVGLDDNGQVWTWGSNQGGELGDSTRGFFDETPEILDFDEDIKQIAVGKSFTMALTASGKLWGWGLSSSYQLGYKDSSTGVKVPIPLSYFDEVEAIQCTDATCAATLPNGEIWMWGANSYGQIGDSTTSIGQPPTLSDRFCLADKASPVGTSMKVFDVTIQYTLADQILTIGLPGESIPDNNVARIYDASGKLIRQQRLTQVENRLSTQGWTAGVYFISVSGEKGNTSKTIAVP